MLDGEHGRRCKKSIKNVLGDAKFILAPMVDQSELAWRLLARRYGAQICFTPMYNANVIVKDATYRRKVLKDISNENDRPLIVQFCANTPEILLGAGRIVQPFCDAIDLNLGCPQHIAKRGHFGAFLQDSWELIHRIISVCSENLNIPVTAKIRVFPEVEKTIQYAKMLEAAGCSMLTVHGRTIEQKGLNTGLADWNQIRQVKDNLNIPVISNGNIQTLDDIHRCIEDTGVDGVMVAESHLSNPCIFLGENPEVYEMVKEYIELVRIHPCPISYVRAHLFKIWVHTLKVYPEFQVLLGGARNLDEMERINEKIHKACMIEDSTSEPNSEQLKHWFCQPHVRGRTEKVKELRHSASADEVISRNQQRRLTRYRRKVEALQFKRQSERERRKERRTEEKLMESETIPRPYSTSNLAKSIINTRLTDAMDRSNESLKVCVDLSWSDLMNNKEISKLAGQIGRLYGSNRKSTLPASLYFSGFSTDSLLYKECARKHNGFENYKITVTEKCFKSLFNDEILVYLSPDAEIELDTVNATHVYVLGGLVDETVKKQLTADKACEEGIIARKLPVHSHMRRSGHHHSYSTVLAINQVFDILLTYNYTKSWKTALAEGMPPRKGYLIKDGIG